MFNRLQQLSEDENRSLRYVILNPQIDFFKNPEAERRGRSLSSPAPAVMTSPTIELSRRSSWSSFFSSAPKSYQKQLVALVTHYSHPMRQGHEQLFNQDKLALANGSKRSSRAEAKAAIAQALLDALEQSGDENLPHVFKANLTSWELNEAAFFEGKTSKILSTEFVSLLKGEAPKNTAHSGSFS
ncbi:MAG: hypothetical protein LRY67_04450 [Gammaproteobacteria bacterium]|nr:hypothetical protein [Gammaproteobacteria bacterium]